MAVTSPELLGLTCEVADCVAVVTPRGWRSVELLLDVKAGQIRVTEVNAKLEGPPLKKPDLGMDEAGRIGGISAALTDMLHLLHGENILWVGKRATLARPTPDQRVLTLVNDDGKPAYSVSISKEYVDGLFLSDAFLDALAEAEPRIAERQAKLEQRLAGMSKWGFDQSSQTVTFEFPDRPALKVPAQILGTWSPDEETWLWAWANTSVDERCTNKVEAAVQPDERAPGFAALWRERFFCESDFAARLAMLVADRMKAEGVYRAKVHDAWVYLALLA